MIAQRLCKNCWHCQDIECRLNPPVVAFGCDEYGHIRHETFWPTIKPQMDWCAKFQQRPDYDEKGRITQD